MPRIIHAADLHLDSPLVGLRRLEGAPVDLFRTATRAAFGNLIQHGLEEDVDLLLLAGDVFDGDLRDFHAAGYFARQLSRLREVGCRVVIVRGNHDAQGVVLRQMALPDHVTLLGSRQPESVVLEELGLVVHGQSYARQAEHENLAAGYPAPVPDLWNVGLLHTSADGVPGADQHVRYAPCTVPQLQAHGYDYWALGHVHTRSAIPPDPTAAPPVLYPGNLQGRHVREPGARGCTWLEVQDGQLTDLEHRDLDVVRWAHCQVDASELATVEDLHEVLAGRFAAVRQASADRPTLVRVTVTGAGPLHGSLARHPDRARHEIEVLAAESGDLWTEQVRFRTTPPAALPQDDLLDLRAAIVRELEQLAADPEALAPYLESLGSVSRKVGRLLAERPDSAERVRALLPQVEALIRARLGVPA